MTLYKIVNNQKIELTAEEISQRQADEQAWLAGAFDRAMADLRSKRNRLIADTDWTQLSDSPYTAEQKFAYADYRQQLRDITNGLTTKEQVDAIIWPTKPGA